MVKHHLHDDDGVYCLQKHAHTSIRCRISLPRIAIHVFCYILKYHSKQYLNKRAYEHSLIA